MVRLLVFYSFMFIFLVGCSSDRNDAANTIEIDGEGEESVVSEELELQSDVFVTDRLVYFTIKLMNYSAEEKKLEFSSSQKYEIIMTDENGQEVYRYSKGKMFAQAIEYALIKPDESVEWEEMLDYKKEKLKPGEYSVTVTILAKDNEGLSKTQTVQIK